jgi:uroporphyrinogen III methyltransferase/synthase
MTVKGEEALRGAEVVLYDNLAGRGVLSRIPPSAESIYVGKRGGEHAMEQSEINALLVKKAREGKRVVRLKGGDPFLFGRGGEEVEALVEAGIPYEVVPGVRSALSVPAYCGIPVTHRDYCSQVHVVTAHGKEGGRSIDWDALAKAGGTLIFLMGAAALQSISDKLIKGGLPRTTPSAILEKGTTARQKKIVTSLEKLAEDAEKAGASAPLITVVGEVCALNFDWYEKQPLSHVRIAVTRPRKRAGALSLALRELGAEVVELPVIRTEALAYTPLLDEIFAGKKHYDWIVFTSPDGVEVFFAKMKEAKNDVRSLSQVKFATIGKTTAAALEMRGIIVDLVPEIYSGEALGRALCATVAHGETVCLPRSRIGSDTLPKMLADKGISYTDIPLYDTLTETWNDATLTSLLLEDLDWIAFTSKSTVENFALLFGKEAMAGRRALCIGKETALAASGYNMETLCAKNATVEDMVNALLG